LAASQEDLSSVEIVSEQGIATDGLYSSQGVREVGRIFSEMYLQFNASLTDMKKQNWLFLYV